MLGQVDSTAEQGFEQGSSSDGLTGLLSMLNTPQIDTKILGSPFYLLLAAFVVTFLPVLQELEVYSRLIPGCDLLPE
jgi:hypothetical protein